MRSLLIAGFLALTSPNWAAAHEFSMGIYATGENARARVASAARGALLAADERDGHPDETSDGHLGGVDVQIIPFPDGQQIALPDLKNSHQGPLDVILVLDFSSTPSLPKMKDETVILTPGDLPELWKDTDNALSFAVRHKTEWSIEPDLSAAQGYHAARRIDAAIRPNDGIDDVTAIREALKRSVTNFAW